MKSNIFLLIVGTLACTSQLIVASSKSRLIELSDKKGKLVPCEPKFSNVSRAQQSRQMGAKNFKKRSQVAALNTALNAAAIASVAIVMHDSESIEKNMHTTKKPHHNRSRALHGKQLSMKVKHAYAPSIPQRSHQHSRAKR